MNLKQQVCSLDLAKRLKELGVKQESMFWYMKPNGLYRDKYDLTHVVEIDPFMFLGEARAIGLGWCLEEYSAFKPSPSLGRCCPGCSTLGMERAKKCIGYTSGRTGRTQRLAVSGQSFTKNGMTARKRQAM